MVFRYAFFSFLFLWLAFAVVEKACAETPTHSLETEEAGSTVDSEGNIAYWVGGQVVLRFAAQGAACNVGTEGAVRYNKATKKFEFCDGTSWNALSN